MKKIIDLCKEVPLLPLTILAAIPLALIPQWRPWGHIHPAFDPGVGEWIIILFVAWTIYTSIREMIDSIRHGHIGVDLLAIVALVSTVCVQQYWASWAVVLMVASGEAIESYAQNKARGNLTALIKAAPQQAHVVTLPGVADGGEAQLTEEGFRKVQQAVEQAQREGKPITMGNGHFDTVPVNDVKLGSVLIVLPGEIVPVDGQLLSGTASVDLSNINGEPVPRGVFAGARVMSGAVNGSTTLTMRATEAASDSQYQRILALVAAARDSRPAVVKTADVLAVPFTVLALAIAAVAWLVSGVPTRFAQVLVLATPCPLLIAAPVAYVAGTGRLAKSGILIKTQDVLENLGRVTHVFFDKTGTLTVKQPQVTRVEMLPGVGTHLNEDHVLMMAGVVETYSVHILAKGIAKAGTEALSRLHRRFEEGQRLCPQPDADWPGHGRDYPVVKHIDEDAGKGISGEVNGHKVRVGRLSFAASSEDGFLPVERIVPGRATTDGDRRSGKQGEGRLADEIRTRFGMLAPDEMASYVSVDGHLIARIVLRDVPRANAKSALASLRGLGVAKLSMLTGDKRSSAAIIASEVGIDDVHAELFPEDKVTAVTTATVTPSRGVTMMVGDGVNDAPVLAAADIGMAMTDGTSTAASESAQVVILNDDIAAVPRAIAIARRTKRVMMQAVLAGLALALIGMVAAAFNLIPVVVGAFLQEAIDVVSILWALTALLDRD